MRILQLMLLTLLTVVGCDGVTADQSERGEKTRPATKSAGAWIPPLEVPDDVKRSAIMGVEGAWARAGGSVDDVTINVYPSEVLTPADRANGITEKWCALVSFIARLGAQPWEDNHRAMLIVRGKDGLKASMELNYSGRKDEAQGAFLSCVKGRRVGGFPCEVCGI